MIHALQLFAQYLHETENWAYHLIRALPETENTIASKYFLKCSYYDPQFRFVKFPLRAIDQPRPGKIDRGYNWLLNRLLSSYPRYLEHHLKEVDVIHAHFAYVSWDYRHLLQRRHIPRVVSFYGTDYQFHKWGPRDRREYFQWFDMFLCEGQYGARKLVEMGCPEAKVAVQHLGVDVGTIGFYGRTKTPNQLNLLQIATFREKKGQIHALRAFLKAVPECPNMTLTFVGGDPKGLRRSIEDLAGREAGGKVRFVDAISYSELHEFMRGYHVFIHPSVHAASGDCEGGAPVVLLDAQATGMPVIATRHCDIPEEVVETKTGILVGEKNTDSLADAIRQFYRMPEKAYQQMAQAARRHVENEYNSEKCGRQLREIYAQAIRGCRA